jgi:pyruvate/2-oxoglutarate dehydrogenase complex dihydrolipoamide acyltransferase (E2) component
MAQIEQILEIISKEHKIDLVKLKESLESHGKLPKKLLSKTVTPVEKGPYDNKRAKEYAEANGISINGIVGTGREGRITIADMKKAGGEPVVNKTKTDDKIKISAAAAKLAGEHGIDVSTLTPSGRRGDILIKDVKQAIENKPEDPLVVEEPEPEVEEPEPEVEEPEPEKDNEVELEENSTDDEEEPELE